MLIAGKWQQCLMGLQATQPEDDVDAPLEGGLTQPGLLTEQKLQRLSILARQRKLARDGSKSGHGECLPNLDN